MNDTNAHALSASSGIDPAQLSAVLLDLYGCAAAEDSQAFRDRALQRLQNVIGLDSALWGVGDLAAHDAKIDEARTLNLPEDAVDLLNRERASTFVVEQCAKAPAEPQLFGPHRLQATARQARVSRYLAIGQLCSVALLDAELRPVSVLNIGRSSQSDPFSATDLAWLRLLAPHLGRMLDLAGQRQLSEASSDAYRPAAPLTRKEWEVATAYASGRSYKEVARGLGMAPATARHHLRECFRKLDVHNKLELERRLRTGS